MSSLAFGCARKRSFTIRMKLKAWQVIQRNCIKSWWNVVKRISILYTCKNKKLFTQQTTKLSLIEIYALLIVSESATGRKTDFQSQIYICCYFRRFLYLFAFICCSYFCYPKGRYKKCENIIFHESRQFFFRLGSSWSSLLKGFIVRISLLERIVFPNNPYSRWNLNFCTPP